MIKTLRQQTQYLSQAIQLEEAVNPAIVKTTMVTISCAIIAFTVWSGFTNINEVARTPGEIVPAGYHQLVQHLEGGIVQDIYVAEGQIVKKGDVLVTLDGEGAKQDLQRAQSKQVSLDLQEERLRAFIEGRPANFAAFQADHADLVKDQASFSRDMVAAHDQEADVVRDQIQQKTRAIESYRTELNTAQSNYAIAAKLFDRRSELHAKGYLSDTKFLEYQQNLNAIRGDIAQIKTKISVAQSEQAEFQNRLKSLGSSYNNNINERLDAVLAEKTQNEELISKLQDRVSRLAIKAPVDGIVKGLSANTIGGVVRPGETLMEIVPTHKDLVVQVKIPPQHIAHLKLGQDVKIKLSSYDFSRYGLIEGKLEYISASTFSAENGDRYYQGRIRMQHQYVGKNPVNIITPGMTVMAEIITGEKTILQYLLKPIHNSLKTAFSER